jgi:hypothetical protein
MKSHTVLSCALAALLSGHVMAQETEKKPDAQQLIEQLGDPSYQVRRDAEKALRNMGKSAKDALEKAAENDKDSEVRWRAGRLLRNLEHQETGGLRARAPGGAAPEQEDQQSGSPDSGNLNEEFEDVFRRLEQDFGVDIPRHRFFNDDFFQDLQQQMQDLQGPDWSQFGDGEGHAFQMRVGPDGVAVEIKQRDANGKTETKKYEAPSLEAFREKYPDIAKQYLDRGHGGFALRFGPDMQWNRGQVHAFPMPAPAPLDDSGPRLGIYTAQMSPDLRTFLGLGDDEGLLVGSVAPDSLAQRLGIEKGDVVLEVNGEHVSSAQDVQRALQAADGDKVSAKINRRGQERTLEAARTEKSEKTDKDKSEKGSTLKPRASKGVVR